MIIKMGCCLSNSSALETPDKKGTNLANIRMSLTCNFLIKSGSFLTDYDVIRVISPSQHKKVIEVRHKRTGEVYVVKEVDKGKGKEEKTGKLIKEAEVLARLGHPNLVKLVEVFDDKKKTYLVMEKLDGGELFDFIAESGMLSERMAAVIMRQLLSAVSYCHKQNVILRNIKPENVLLANSVTRVEDIVVKLADFGLSTATSAGESRHKKVGTELYTAPEIFQGDYTQQCDIWSLGAVLYVMLSGSLPFDAQDPEELREQICTGNYSLHTPQWDLISEDAKDLISHMMEVNPSQRYSADAALLHPWIQASTTSTQEDEAKSKALLFGLRQFQGEKKLKTALSLFISDKFGDKQEAEEMRKMFEALDKDHSGILTRDELIQGLSASMDPEDATTEADSILKNMDSDTSKGIDYKEFLAASASQKQQYSKDMLDKAFQTLDADHSGKISVKELTALLGKGVEGGNSGLKQLISQSDANGDGQLSLKEFSQLLLQQ